MIIDERVLCRMRRKQWPRCAMVQRCRGTGQNLKPRPTVPPELPRPELPQPEPVAERQAEPNAQVLICFLIFLPCSLAGTS